MDVVPAATSRPPSPPTDENKSGIEVLSDEVLLRILGLLPSSAHTAISLVSKRFLRLLGLLRRSLTLLRLPSFLSLRIPSRFPLLLDLHLVPSLLHSPDHTPLLLSRAALSLPLDPHLPPLSDPRFLTSDPALIAVARHYPNLRRLSIPATASASALLDLAHSCPTLQDLEIHRCTDASLRPVSAFRNLQILRLVAALPGLYPAEPPGVTDVGLTILAHACGRLVRLDLSACEGSYDGVSAVGRCCPMLEELVLCDHRMDAGWLAGLQFCGNLKTLRLVGCRNLDEDPGPEEHLGSCMAIEKLHLQRCHLRDKRSLNALFVVCAGVRDLVFQDCWGLDDDMFSVTGTCRRVNFLCLEGCSLLTTAGLESVITSMMELQSLSVVSCKSMKDMDISPALSSLFAMLKELKWRPDSRTVLLEGLRGSGMWKKGGRLFKRT